MSGSGTNRDVGKGWAHKLKNTPKEGGKLKQVLPQNNTLAGTGIPELTYSQGTAQKVSETPPAREEGLIQERDDE